MFTGIALDPNDWGHMNGGGGLMWLWGLGVLLVIVGLAIGFLFLVLRTGAGVGGPAATAPGDRAKAILAERYARGEVSTEEYRERQHELT